MKRRRVEEEEEDRRDGEPETESLAVVLQRTIQEGALQQSPEVTGRSGQGMWIGKGGVRSRWAVCRLPKADRRHLIGAR